MIVILFYYLLIFRVLKCCLFSTYYIQMIIFETGSLDSSESKGHLLSMVAIMAVTISDTFAENVKGFNCNTFSL